MIREINEQDFDSKVLKSKGITLVDFWADWCTPCKMMSPILEHFARETNINIVKINVNDNNAIAAKYGVCSIPYLMFFKNGKIVNQLMGFQTKEKLVEATNAVV